MRNKKIKNIIEDGIKSGRILIQSEDNKHLFTEEDLAILDKINKQELLSPKYWRAQKRLVIEKTQEAFQQVPQIPIKQVMVNIFSGLPDFLPPHNMVEVSTYIVEEWTRLQQHSSSHNKNLAIESLT